MARRRTVLTIPIPAGGVEMADVLAVLTGVGPSYDLTRIEVGSTREGESFLVLTAGQRRLRPGVLIGAEPLPGIEEDWSAGEQPGDTAAEGAAISVPGVRMTLSHPPRPFPAVDEAGLIAGRYDEHAWAAPDSTGDEVAGDGSMDWADGLASVDGG